MSDLLREFERDCARAYVKPTDALRAGGVHGGLWSKWQQGHSPTLVKFEAARRGLAAILARREKPPALTGSWPGAVRAEREDC